MNYTWCLCRLGQLPPQHPLLVDVALEHAPLEERLAFLGAISLVDPYL